MKPYSFFRPLFSIEGASTSTVAIFCVATVYYNRFPNFHGQILASFSAQVFSSFFNYLAEIRKEESQLTILHRDTALADADNLANTADILKQQKQWIAAANMFRLSAEAFKKAFSYQSTVSTVNQQQAYSVTYKRAYCLFHGGKPNEALQILLDKSLEQSIGRSKICTLQGLIYLALNQTTNAVMVFSNALKLDPAAHHVLDLKNFAERKINNKLRLTLLPEKESRLTIPQEKHSRLTVPIDDFTWCWLFQAIKCNLSAKDNLPMCLGLFETLVEAASFLPMHIELELYNNLVNLYRTLPVDQQYPIFNLESIKDQPIISIQCRGTQKLTRTFSAAAIPIYELQCADLRERIKYCDEKPMTVTQPEASSSSQMTGASNP